MNSLVKINDTIIGHGNPLVIIAGPCVIEDLDTTMTTATFLKELTEKLDIPFIFKSSYDKANRSSINSFRGPGLIEGLKILERIKSDLNLKIISDIHSIDEIEPASRVLDILQIPAFLCRQTDLLVAAAKSGKPVNVKKGQFLAPWDIKNVVEKILSTGNEQILVTERGVTFGYNNLVVDFRAVKIIKDSGFPVIFDATHSVQLPGGSGDRSSGQRELAPLLARAAVAAGVDGIFLEVHPDPDNALCDGPNSLQLDRLEDLLLQLVAIKKACNTV